MTPQAMLVLLVLSLSAFGSRAAPTGSSTRKITYIVRDEADAVNKSSEHALGIPEDNIYSSTTMSIAHEERDVNHDKLYSTWPQNDHSINNNFFQKSAQYVQGKNTNSDKSFSQVSSNQFLMCNPSEKEKCQHIPRFYNLNHKIKYNNTIFTQPSNNSNKSVNESSKDLLKSHQNKENYYFPKFGYSDYNQTKFKVNIINDSNNFFTHQDIVFDHANRNEITDELEHVNGKENGQNDKEINHKSDQINISGKPKIKKVVLNGHKTNYKQENTTRFSSDENESMNNFSKNIINYYTQEYQQNLKRRLRRGIVKRPGVIYTDEDDNFYEGNEAGEEKDDEPENLEAMGEDRIPEQDSHVNDKTNILMSGVEHDITGSNALESSVGDSVDVAVDDSMQEKDSSSLKKSNLFPSNKFSKSLNKFSNENFHNFVQDLKLQDPALSTDNFKNSQMKNIAQKMTHYNEDSKSEDLSANEKQVSNLDSQFSVNNKFRNLNDHDKNLESISTKESDSPIEDSESRFYDSNINGKISVPLNLKVSDKVNIRNSASDNCRQKENNFQNFNTDGRRINIQKPDMSHDNMKARNKQISPKTDNDPDAIKLKERNVGAVFANIRHFKNANKADESSKLTKLRNSNLYDKDSEEANAEEPDNTENDSSPMSLWDLDISYKNSEEGNSQESNADNKETKTDDQQNSDTENRNSGIANMQIPYKNDESKADFSQDTTMSKKNARESNFHCANLDPKDSASINMRGLKCGCQNLPDPSAKCSQDVGSKELCFENSGINEKDFNSVYFNKLGRQEKNSDRQIFPPDSGRNEDSSKIRFHQSDASDKNSEYVNSENSDVNGEYLKGENTQDLDTEDNENDDDDDEDDDDIGEDEDDYDYLRPTKSKNYITSDHNSEADKIEVSFENGEKSRVENTQEGEGKTVDNFKDSDVNIKDPELLRPSDSNINDHNFKQQNSYDSDSVVDDSDPNNVYNSNHNGKLTETVNLHDSKSNSGNSKVLGTSPDANINIRESRVSNLQESEMKKGDYPENSALHEEGLKEVKVADAIKQDKNFESENFQDLHPSGKILRTINLGDTDPDNPDSEETDLEEAKIINKNSKSTGADDSVKKRNKLMTIDSENLGTNADSRIKANFQDSNFGDKNYISENLEHSNIRNKNSEEINSVYSDMIDENLNDNLQDSDINNGDSIYDEDSYISEEDARGTNTVDRDTDAKDERSFQMGNSLHSESDKNSENPYQKHSDMREEDAEGMNLEDSPLNQKDLVGTHFDDLNMNERKSNDIEYPDSVESEYDSEPVNFQESYISSRYPRSINFNVPNVVVRYPNLGDNQNFYLSKNYSVIANLSDSGMNGSTKVLLFHDLNKNTQNPKSETFLDSIIPVENPKTEYFLYPNMHNTDSNIRRFADNLDRNPEAATTVTLEYLSAVKQNKLFKRDLHRGYSYDKYPNRVAGKDNSFIFNKGDKLKKNINARHLIEENNIPYENQDRKCSYRHSPKENGATFGNYNANLKENGNYFPQIVQKSSRAKTVSMNERSKENDETYSSINKNRDTNMNEIESKIYSNTLKSRKNNNENNSELKSNNLRSERRIFPLLRRKGKPTIKPKFKKHHRKNHTKIHIDDLKENYTLPLKSMRKHVSSECKNNNENIGIGRKESCWNRNRKHLLGNNIFRNMKIKREIKVPEVIPKQELDSELKALFFEPTLNDSNLQSRGTNEKLPTSVDDSNVQGQRDYMSKKSKDLTLLNYNINHLAYDNKNESVDISKFKLSDENDDLERYNRSHTLEHITSEFNNSKITRHADNKLFFNDLNVNDEKAELFKNQIHTNKNNLRTMCHNKTKENPKESDNTLLRKNALATYKNKLNYSKKNKGYIQNDSKYKPMKRDIDKGNDYKKELYEQQKNVNRNILHITNYETNVGRTLYKRQIGKEMVNEIDIPEERKYKHSILRKLIKSQEEGAGYKNTGILSPQNAKKDYAKDAKLLKYGYGLRNDELPKSDKKYSIPGNVRKYLPNNNDRIESSSNVNKKFEKSLIMDVNKRRYNANSEMSDVPQIYDDSNSKITSDNKYSKNSDDSHLSSSEIYGRSNDIQLNSDADIFEMKDDNGKKIKLKDYELITEILKTLYSTKHDIETIDCNCDKRINTPSCICENNAGKRTNLMNVPYNNSTESKEKEIMVLVDQLVKYIIENNNNSAPQINITINSQLLNKESIPNEEEHDLSGKNETNKLSRKLGSSPYTSKKKDAKRKLSLLKILGKAYKLLSIHVKPELWVLFTYIKEQVRHVCDFLHFIHVHVCLCEGLTCLLEEGGKHRHTYGHKREIPKFSEENQINSDACDGCLKEADEFPPTATPIKVEVIQKSCNDGGEDLSPKSDSCPSNPEETPMLEVINIENRKRPEESIEFSIDPQQGPSIANNGNDLQSIKLKTFALNEEEKQSFIAGDNLPTDFSSDGIPPANGGISMEISQSENGCVEDDSQQSQDSKFPTIMFNNKEKKLELSAADFETNFRQKPSEKDCYNKEENESPLEVNIYSSDPVQARLQNGKLVKEKIKLKLEADSIQTDLHEPPLSEDLCNNCENKAPPSKGTCRAYYCQKMSFPQMSSENEENIISPREDNFVSHSNEMPVQMISHDGEENDKTLTSVDDGSMVSNENILNNPQQLSSHSASAYSGQKETENSDANFLTDDKKVTNVDKEPVDSENVNNVEDQDESNLNSKYFNKLLRQIPVKSRDQFHRARASISEGTAPQNNERHELQYKGHKKRHFPEAYSKNSKQYRIHPTTKYGFKSPLKNKITNSRDEVRENMKLKTENDKRSNTQSGKHPLSPPQESYTNFEAHKDIENEVNNKLLSPQYKKLAQKAADFRKRKRPLTDTDKITGRPKKHRKK